MWDDVLRRLRVETAPVVLEAWLQPLLARPAAEGLVLVAPTAFHRERVRTRFGDRIRSLAEEAAGRAIPVTFELAEAADAGPGVSSQPARRERAGPAAEPPRPPAPDRPTAQLTLPATFDTFVTGPGNALAREASFALARKPELAFFPLFLLGESGTGKTHLARAVVSEARRNGVERAVYVSAERFTNDFTAAIRERHGAAFRRRYRQECDLLVLEDVQFLAGKRQTQLELFHVVEHLRAVGARVVLTGDQLPRQIANLSPRLASQMAGGLVAELELPDRALRRAILRDRASRGGVALPGECLDLLVDGIRGSVRDIEGVLTQLVASASLLGRPIDRALTEAALRKVSGPTPVRCEPGAVIASVAAFFGVSPGQLASRSRAVRFGHPRQLAMYLCHRYTDASLSEIGRYFGRRHASVSNAIQKVERDILARAPLRYQVEELAARIEGRREAQPVRREAQPVRREAQPVRRDPQAAV